MSAWPAVNDAAFRSRGHLMSPEFVDVRISAEARETYLALVTDSVLPDGTTVALFFTDEPRRDRGPVFVMEKRSDSWRFFAVDPQGKLDPSQSGEACARCHAGATADSVFGLPRDARIAPTGLPAEK